MPLPLRSMWRPTGLAINLALVAAVLVTVAWMLQRNLDTSSPDITIRATGMQRQWSFDYLDGEGAGISFVSTPRVSAAGGELLREVDRTLVVPVNKKIRVSLTAVDIIHEWYIPGLGVNQPAVPSLLRDTAFRADKTGIYRSECTDLCGPDHLCLPVVIEVVDEARYREWVAARQGT